MSSLIDIRKHAVSRYRPEYSKKNLSASLGKSGIDYVHIPELGVPSEKRRNVSTAAGWDELWSWYDENVVERFARRNLWWYFDASQHPVALMCVEYDFNACHRHRLSAGLNRSGLIGRNL